MKTIKQKTHISLLLAFILAFAALLGACSGAGTDTADATSAAAAADDTDAADDADVSDDTDAADGTDAADDAETTSAAESTVEITDSHGTVTVPVNPEVVVSLDNRTFETLDNWGITLAAAPKGLIPDGISYADDDSVQDIGTHNDPDLEVIAAVDPDLVIVGQRFASYYDDIVELVPDAAVIDLAFTLSDEAGESGDSLVNGLKDSVATLGLIFDKNEEAQELSDAFDAAIAAVSEAYNGTDTVMSVIVSGGEIGFSAPYSGRVWGPMYDLFGWVQALNIDNATSDHQGDDISVEAIAQSNPDWILVLDRDAATSSGEDYTPASDVISNAAALQNTTAVILDQVIYAPADTYTNESIQTYLELFEDLAAAFGG